MTAKLEMRNLDPGDPLSRPELCLSISWTSLFDRLRHDLTVTDVNGLLIELIRHTEQSVLTPAPLLGLAGRLLDRWDREINSGAPLFECQNCGATWREARLKTIKDLEERVAPGEIVPYGECPTCGAVCHPYVVPYQPEDG